MEKKSEVFKILKDKKSRLSNGDTELAAKTAMSIYLEDKDIDNLINNLTSIYYKVSGMFVKKHLPTLDEKEIDIFFKSLTNNDVFKKPKGSNYINLGFEIIRNGIGHDVINKYCVTLFLIITNLSHKKKEFTATSKNQLNNLLNQKHSTFFKLDFYSCNIDERRLILKFILESTPNISNCTYLESLKEWAEKYNFDLGKIEVPKENKDTFSGDKKEEGKSIAEDNDGVVNTQKNNNRNVNEEVTVVTTNMNENIQKTVELLGLLTTASREVEKLIKNVINKNMSIEVLEKLVKEKDEEIHSLKNQLIEKENNIGLLSFQAEKFDGRLNEKQAEIDDLTERLKKSFDSDEFTKNQELVTLKKNITNSLKLQYSDYCDLKESVCREDEFEVLKVILGQVFRILSKYGIDF